MYKVYIRDHVNYMSVLLHAIFIHVIAFNRYCKCIWVHYSSQEKNDCGLECSCMHGHAIAVQEVDEYKAFGISLTHMGCKKLLWGHTYIIQPPHKNQWINFAVCLVI